MVSEASQRWPTASPLYLEQKERKTPVADAGLLASPTSEEEVRREGKTIITATGCAFSDKSIHTYLELERPPAETQKSIQMPIAKREGPARSSSCYEGCTLSPATQEFLEQSDQVPLHTQFKHAGEQLAYPQQQRVDGGAAQCMLRHAPSF